MTFSEKTYEYKILIIEIKALIISNYSRYFVFCRKLVKERSNANYYFVCMIDVAVLS